MASWWSTGALTKFLATSGLTDRPLAESLKSVTLLVLFQVPTSHFSTSLASLFTSWLFFLSLPLFLLHDSLFLSRPLSTFPHLPSAAHCTRHLSFLLVWSCDHHSELSFLESCPKKHSHVEMGLAKILYLTFLLVWSCDHSQLSILFELSKTAVCWCGVFYNALQWLN